jgi:hypothetical protein
MPNDDTDNKMNDNQKNNKETEILFWTALISSWLTLLFPSLYRLDFTLVAGIDSIVYQQD